MQEYLKQSCSQSSDSAWNRVLDIPCGSAWSWRSRTRADRVSSMAERRDASISTISRTWLQGTCSLTHLNSRLSMQRDIAVYSADGELLHWIDEKRLRRLAECGRIARVVKTGRDGSSARHCTRCPARRGHRSCPTTRARSYCFRQHLEDNHRCHRFRSLGDNRNDDEHYLSPEEVRPIFLRVVLDCLAPRSESCAPSVEATTSRSSTTLTFALRGFGQS